MDETTARDERRYAEAVDEIDRLLRRDRDAKEEDALDALSEVVAAYEDKYVPIPDASEADVLRVLLAANRLTPARLAAEAGVPASAVSAVLNGSRSFSRAQVEAVARYFAVSPAAFFPK